MSFVVYSNLRFARENFGYTVRELANEIGGDFSSLSKNENGKRGLPIEHVKPLANVLDCSCEFIMQESEFGLYAYYGDSRVILTIEQYKELESKGLVKVVDCRRIIKDSALADDLLISYVYKLNDFFIKG